MTLTIAAPSGTQHHIGGHGYHATIVEVSGGLRELHFGGRPLLDGYRENEMCTGARGQLLIPWPNRIDRGRYQFNGKNQQLAITEPERDCAIHGLTRWANWTAHPARADSAPGAAAEADRLTMRYRLHAQPGWPHTIDLEVEYLVAAGTGLTVTVSATNIGAEAAPYSSGAHPYLSAGTDTINTCLLQVPADTHVTTDGRGIPTGAEPVAGTTFDFRKSRLLGETKLDDAYTDLRRDDQGRAWTTIVGPDGHGVSLWVDESCRWLEVFTGDHLPDFDKRRTGLGVEPMTCPPNAYASGEGLITLEPGQTATTRWGIVAHPSEPQDEIK